MLDDIKQEKNKLDELTKLIGSHLRDTKTSIDTLKTNKDTHEKQHIQEQEQYKEQEKQLKDFKIYLDDDEHIKKQLEIDDADIAHMPKETINKVLNILKNYINMDKSFRLKHDTLKTLYISYIKLYKKYKEQHNNNNKTKKTTLPATTQRQTQTKKAIEPEKTMQHNKEQNTQEWLYQNAYYKQQANQIQHQQQANQEHQHSQTNQQQHVHIQEHNDEQYKLQSDNNITQQPDTNLTKQDTHTHHDTTNIQPSESNSYIECKKNLNNKHKRLLFSNNTNTNSNSNSNICDDSEEDNAHNDILKNIHDEMKNNNSNMYRERIIILKKIKNEPEIDLQFKNKICGRLIAIFKLPPTIEQQTILYKTNNNNNTNNEGIKVNELDNAYLQKHNELLTVFQAYKNLYNKVLNYKEQLDEYKKISVKSRISRGNMDKMIKDQSFIMDSIDKMQDKLVDDKIINNSEKVLITPVINNPENIGYFNDTMRDQIHNIIDRNNNNIKPHIKMKIESLIAQYKNNTTQEQQLMPQPQTQHNANNYEKNLHHKLLILQKK